MERNGLIPRRNIIGKRFSIEGKEQNINGKGFSI